ncbi:hypothetical protein CDD82_972 [Ophiocordyceps australis]|uniref:F-box domain-containing protein n=1 Tax=Ophiocordyceps australis TaxID=1399860 RepID=A0A2C5Y0B2_9HYPO|nr:hypothetical protein CDD82_972 [Ophiocordyceps australis]
MTPLPPSPSHAGPSEPRPPRARQQQLVNPVQNPSDLADSMGRRFQLQLSECVETKTVTTTTRLTRKFPRVFVRDPPSLQQLDAAEYPLASKPTPPELLDLCVDLSFGSESSQHYARQPDRPAPEADSNIRRLETKLSRQNNDSASIATARHPSVAADGLDRLPVRPPSDAHSRRNRKMRATLADLPADNGSKSSHPQHKAPRPAHSLAMSDKLRRSIIQASSGNADLSTNIDAGSSAVSHYPSKPDYHISTGYGGLGTPDASLLADASRPSSRRRSTMCHDANDTPPPPGPHSSQVSFDAASPSSDSQTVFSSEVATPPVTDADTEDSLQHAVLSIHHHRPAIDAVAAQDASLPSPRLSPTLAASQVVSTDHDDDGMVSLHTSVVGRHTSSWRGALQTDPNSECQEFSTLSSFQVNGPSEAQDQDQDQAQAQEHAQAQGNDANNDAPPLVIDPELLLNSFESMRPHMKAFMMYQFLRRCPRSTLRIVANTVNPAFKCDFLDKLPLEMAYSVLSYLDCRDLCRGAQVSKRWRTIINCNERGWKDLMDRDGFTLPSSELQKAIAQGWGWQDPVGIDGYEKDLSMKGRLTQSEEELMSNVRPEGAARARTSKRKRPLNAYASSERVKRRASNSDRLGSNEPTAHQHEMMKQRSEGPLSAANAAAAAISNPQLGLPELRQLHLFKSLYRRHFLIRQGWMSGQIEPSHVAFTAHPRHVITCLQFDDDKIITGSDDTLIHIYDTKTGKLRRRLEGHEGGVWALQYEGNILVSGSTDRSVRVWDIERGLCQQVFYGHTSTVRCLQVLMPSITGHDATGRAIMQPEKPLIITGSRDSQLRVWRLPEVGSRRYIQTHPPAQETDCPYFIRTLSGHSNSVRAIAAHGDTLVSGSYDSTVRVWGISTGERVHVLGGHTAKVYSVVLDHERKRCISGAMDSLVKIWDLKTGTCLHSLEGHTLLVGLLDLRDERLVSAAADATLRVWDPETGRCKHTLLAHSGAITCFQHDGRKVISGSEKTVKMWDARTGEYVRNLLTDLSGVWQVKFDDRRCVAAVQRDQLTYLEILDFGARRDGVPPEDLGKRVLLNENEVREILDEGPA